MIEMRYNRVAQSLFEFHVVNGDTPVIELLEFVANPDDPVVPVHSLAAAFKAVELV